MKHVWVRQPCWPTAESHPASPAVEAFHRSSSPSSCLPAAVPSAGPGPVLAVRQPAAQRTRLVSPPPQSAACAEWRAQTSATCGDHASRPASLGVPSRGNDVLSPVRQTGQPTQQTTVPAAHQHSPAHAVPVVVQAASQGGLHASPVVKLNPDEQVATFARMQGHKNPGLPRYYHIPAGARATTSNHHNPQPPPPPTTTTPNHHLLHPPLPPSPPSSTTPHRYHRPPLRYHHPPLPPPSSATTLLCNHPPLSPPPSSTTRRC